MSNPRVTTLAAASALALGGYFAAPAALAQHDHEHGAAAAATTPAAPPPAAEPDATQHAEHSAPLAAEHAGHDAHAEHGLADQGPALPTPTAVDRAAAFPDLGGMTHDLHEDPLNKAVLLNRFETRDAEQSVLAWDLDAWVGKSLTRLWIRTEGERVSSDTERADLELLWGRGITRWWDLVAGARHDFAPGADRNWAAAGVRGLAPYRFDIEATAYVGDGGRAAFRFESQYDVLVTNRLILQPLLELRWNAQTDLARGEGAGLAECEVGVRLRYEFRREVAPYIGLVHESKLGRTEDWVRAGNRDPSDVRLVAGIRLSF